LRLKTSVCSYGSLISAKSSTSKVDMTTVYSPLAGHVDRERYLRFLRGDCSIMCLVLRSPATMNQNCSVSRTATRKFLDIRDVEWLARGFVHG